MRIVRVHGHSVLVDVLKPGSIVLDCGTNHGAFASEIARLAECRPICLEPNPELFARLAENSQLRVYRAAIVDQSRKMEFHVAENDECSSLLSPTLSAVKQVIECEGWSIRDLLSIAGLNRIDLLKMDIEGFELRLLPALEKEVLDRIDQVAVEFHESMGLGTRKEVRALIKNLERSGFRAIRGSFFDYSDVLFLHPQRLHLGRTWRWQAVAQTLWNGLQRRCGCVTGQSLANKRWAQDRSTVAG